MEKKDNTRSLGNSEERRAAEFLEDNGCRIIERNFSCRAGEIDLIYYDEDNVICFGEVKYRYDENAGYPSEAVDIRKQRKICRVSDMYRAKFSLDESYSYRYDVIAIKRNEIQWIKNAFYYIER
ncbi:MAG: YraN family protein [Lachnospiraceae bacterium]|nr:YraN family protein [Lachnospiraceae bacterium]